MKQQNGFCCPLENKKIMEELIRKFLYAGVGIVALTAEKLQEAVDEMIGEGKVSKDEGKQIVEDFVENMDSKREEFEDRLKQAAENMVSGMKRRQHATKEDIDALMERISALEAKLGTDSPQDVKEAVEEVKKAAKKKTSASDDAESTAS